VNPVNPVNPVENKDPVTLAIQTRDLTKRFPDPRRLLGVPLPFGGAEGTLAVDRVTLAVHQGEVFGLVGPNGAGKTTLVKMLTTLILPTAGQARVGGYELRAENNRQIKASIGLVTGNERSFYPRLSCRENLHFYAGLHNLSRTEATPRIAELASLLDLDAFLDKRYDTCSTGMKHRLALARSLINTPSLLFLDEPTRSLDPVAAARFRQAVYALAHRDRCTVFLVTHDLDEAAELCDRVGVMVQGRLRVVDAPGDLRRALRGDETCSLQVRDAGPGLDDALRTLDQVEVVGARARTAAVTELRLRLADRRRVLPAVTHVIAEGGGTIEGLTFEGASWEAAVEGLEAGSAGAAAATAPRPPSGDAAGETSQAARMGDQPPTGHVAAGRMEAQPDSSHGPGKAAEANAALESRRRGWAGPLSKPLLFFRRDLRTQMRYRLSFLLQLLGILFSSASFYFVAQLLGANAAPQLGDYGGDYFSFVLIGIAFVGYQSVALHTFSGVIRSAQSLGTLEAILVTPTRLATILFSSSLWSFAYTSLRVGVYLLAGVTVFGADLGQANLLAGLLVLGLTVLTLSSIGVLSACFIMVFKRGSPINFLIGSLSSLLAGVYYPLEVLPSWLQRVARLFPLTYSLEAMRRALLQGESVRQLGRELAVLAAFALVLLPLGLAAFHAAVRQAKRDGSLTHF
jgi:ABC-2 type transport system permease protein